MEPMRILITGGTGFLGHHIAERLLEDGHTLTLLGRTASSNTPQRGLFSLRCDLRHRAAVIAACRGQDAVIHAGALSAPWGRWEDFYAINVRGTAAILEGCERFGVTRLIQISSPAVVFTGGDHQQTTEDAPYPRRFSSAYAQSKALAEQLVRNETRVASVILRPKAIFGPGDRALLPRLVAAARAGRLPQVGTGQNLVDLTYVRNVADAVALALHRSAALGRTYHITNNEHVPLWPLIRRVLRELGLNDRLRAVPLPLMLAVAASMELRAKLTGCEPLLTRYSVAILGRTQTYDISAAQRDLGYQPRVTIADGVAHTLGYLRQEVR